MQLVLTCEHGGHRVPREYRRLFRGAEDVLESHRGWDPGALIVARRLAKALHAPLLATTWCRLLVESNRAPTNRRIWSAYTANLPSTDKKRILERYWWPHRHAVESRIGKLVATGECVLHIAVHSFTPVLAGVQRNADIALLYDPKRRREATLCRDWERLLEASDHGVRVRRNYPYIGATDGLTTWLRRRHPKNRYLGVELEINQNYYVRAGARTVQDLLTSTLKKLLERKT